MVIGFAGNFRRSDSGIVFHVHQAIGWGVGAIDQPSTGNISGFQQKKSALH
jgi:hypothetical protein